MLEHAAKALVFLSLLLGLTRAGEAGTAIRNVTVEIASRLERTPRGKTPLIVHRPRVHDALRSHGIEPLFTR